MAVIGGHNVVEIDTRKATCYAILALDDRKLTPEAKYFLIRIAYLYGNAFVSTTVKVLAKTVGLTEATLKKVRTLLSGLNYIEVTPKSVNKEKIGRPRLTFKITSTLMNKVSQQTDRQLTATCQEEHSQLLKKLLFWSNEGGEGDALRERNIKKIKKTDKESPTTHTFTIATRLLLANLYSRADPCGVVINLGLSKLSGLTGMSADRLKSQLDVIKNLGYLIDRTPGLTGKRLFGHATGAFYMNVSDDDCQALGSFTLVAFETRSINHYNEENWGFYLYDKYLDDAKKDYQKYSSDQKPPLNSFDFSDRKLDVSEIEFAENLNDLLERIRVELTFHGIYGRKSKKINDNPTSIFTGDVGEWSLYWLDSFNDFRLYDFFCDTPMSDFSKYLQFQIDHHTSLILNLGWGKIKTEKLIIIDSVLDRIASNLFPRPLKNNNIESIRRSALVLFLYCISYQQALMVKSLILKAEIAPDLLTDDQSSCSFAILPSHLKIYDPALRMTVAIRSPLRKRPKDFFAVTFNSSHSKQIEKFSQLYNPVICQKIFNRFGYDIAVLQSMTK